jgi:hypothetical protein
LVIDPGKPLDEQLDVRKKDWPADNQPFDSNAAPIEIAAQARKIPNWRQDHLGLCDEVQPSPVKSDRPTETITLIPMGAARLRISAFPWIGSRPGAHEWQPPRQPSKGKIPSKASHCNDGDTVAALSDGDVPSHSNDHDITRFTWWPRKGTTEWVQYNFAKPRRVTQVEVYWFDDLSTGGGCRTPASWRLLYRDGNAWKEISSAEAYGVQKDRFNEVTFAEVTTTALRLEAQLQPDYSAGILEWRIK